MEACCGAHHLGRGFAAQGHEVRLMSPEYVRPYVKAQKNDDLDAAAIAEAASRPTMRFVEVKSQAQSDIQALHRARERLVSERTALINPLRALLLIEDLRTEWRALDERIAVFDKEFVQMARNEEPVRRLVTIPGIGTINATALVAAVGNARAFRRGRDMAAWLGLTPRQITTGGKPRLLGISKRGNRYLRKNLIHGARAVLPYLVEQKTPLSRWARELLARAHKNVVVVALANKLARIAWVVLARGGVYNTGYEAVAA
jgi:transposase